MRWLIELIKSIINYPATLYDRWLKYYYLTPHPISRWHLDMIKKFWGLWEPSKIMSFSIFLFFLTILLYTIQNLITPRFLSTLKSNFGFEYDPWKISIFLNIDLNRLFMYPLGACQLGFFYIFFYASEKIRDIYIYLDVSVLLATPQTQELFYVSIKHRWVFYPQHYLSGTWAIISHPIIWKTSMESYVLQIY